MIDLNAAPRAERRGPSSWRSDGGLVHKGNPAIAELAVLPQWVLWKGKRKPDGRIEKVPYCVGGRRKASATDPRTWDTFDACWTSAFVDGQADGIGFVFSEGDPYCGVDLDECRDPATGEITEEARLWLDYFDTYAEVSPSRTGVKVIARATLPGRGRKAGGLEIYDRGRFFAITGDHLDGTPEEIGEAQEAAEAVLAQITSRSKTARASRHACNGAADRVDLGPDDDPRWHTCPDEIRTALGALLEDFPASEVAQCLDCSGTPPEDSTRSGWMARLARLLQARLGWEADDIAGGLVFMCERHGWADKLGREVKRAAELVMSDEAERERFTLPPEPAPRPEPAPSASATLERLMFHGPLGDLVRLYDPDTEADPKGVLACLLVGLGNQLGRRFFKPVGAERHYPTLHTLLVGETALARKGTAWGLARMLLGELDHDWADNNLAFSINSGEGLIGTVQLVDADARERQEAAGKVVVGDKRVLFVVAEFGEVLKRAKGTTSTILPVLRSAWDCTVLQNTSLTRRMRVAGATVGLVGMITLVELTELISLSELATGSLNRILIMPVRREKALRGDPPNLEAWPARPILDRIKANLAAAEAAFTFKTDGMQLPVGMTGEATELAADLKERFETPGANWVEAGNSRAYVQVMRAAVIYALVDGQNQITPVHLDAAADLVDAATEGVRAVATSELSDKVAERILIHMREDPSEALTRTGISVAVFNKHVAADKLENAVSLLKRLGMLHERRASTSGRPVTVYQLTSLGQSGA